MIASHSYLRTLLILALSAVVIIGCALTTLRLLDHRADLAERDRLTALQPKAPAIFDRRLVAGLPEPAQRFFLFAIEEGTPLYTVAQIGMEGRFGMGSLDTPFYLAMQAQETLAAPHGFLWKMSTVSSEFRFSGSDSGKWTRFWLFELFPILRDGGSLDHRRSAFARFVAEAAIWTPAAVLPGPGVTWEGIGSDAARLTVRQGDLEQSVDITVGEDGRPSKIALLRWSNANPDKEYRLQSFGGTLSNFSNFDGYQLPTHIEAGNHFGEYGYFPFFIADVVHISFPKR